MSLYAFKPRFQAWLRPVAGVLFRAGITANQVTIATCAVSVGLGVLLAWNVQATALFLLLPVWQFLRMALNAIDGMLAREHGQASALGACLNELCDVLADAALAAPFVFLPGAGAAFVALAIFLACVAEMAGLVALLAGSQRRHDGPMGKSDRAFVLGALALAIGCGAAPGPWLGWAFALIALALVVTIVNRIRRAVTPAAGS
jgi:CDP-diacylglycerol--glycerol-3-phosphate 3-phosphatidyltransferase